MAHTSPHIEHPSLSSVMPRARYSLCLLLVDGLAVHRLPIQGLAGLGHAQVPVPAPAPGDVRGVGGDLAGDQPVLDILGGREGRGARQG